MVAFTFPRIAAALSALVCVGSAAAAPLIDARAKPKPADAPAAPYFVIYGDQWISGGTGIPPVADVTGYNVL